MTVAALPHVLLIEDDDGHAAIVTDALRGAAVVHRVATDAEALRLLAMIVPDVVISDLRGTSDAAPLLAATSLRIALDRVGAARGVTVPLVLASGLDPHVVEGIAGSLAHTHALPKPSSPSALRALVESLT